MVKITNKLVRDRQISAAKRYSSFAIRQVEMINRALPGWLKEQAFASAAPSPLFGGINIDGSSNDNLVGEKDPDHVEWKLQFEYQLKDGLERKTAVESAFLDGLLHIKRLPNKERFNSAPNIFKTSNYIQIRVSNDERDWVVKGAFPKNTHLTTILEDEDTSRPQQRVIAAYTDIRRDALTGFALAREWAKFRTMAVASKGYISDVLRTEWAKIGRDYNEGELMRSRTEAAVPLMLELLPETRNVKGNSSLKPFYLPGVLEAVAALEVEKGKYPHFGQTDEVRPIYYARGSPIEITHIPGKNIEYDARLSFEINLYNSGQYKDEVIRGIVEKELQKHFDISFENSSKLRVNLNVPQAHKVVQAIHEGKTDTSLHSQISSLRDALCIVYRSCEAWEHEQEPVLKTGYEAMMTAARQTHFGRLEGIFAQNRGLRGQKRG